MARLLLGGWWQFFGGSKRGSDPTIEQQTDPAIEQSVAREGLLRLNQHYPFRGPLSNSDEANPKDPVDNTTYRSFQVLHYHIITIPLTITTKNYPLPHFIPYHCNIVLPLPVSPPVHTFPFTRLPHWLHSQPATPLTSQTLWLSSGARCVRSRRIVLFIPG